VTNLTVIMVAERIFERVYRARGDQGVSLGLRTA
jgi:hypothetical protein